jgi:hypothetical protein
MSKILFRIGQTFQHRTRFGEVANLFQGCYFRGKELGYNDGDIYFEWPMKVQFNNEYRKQIYFPCPKYSILPIKFINRKDVVLTEFNEIKNLVDKGVFYEDSLPLYIGDQNNPSIQHQNYLGPMDYLNKYYYETGRRPIFEIPKDNTNKYILFHFRNTIWSTYRNPNPKIFMDVFNNLKDKY